MTLAATATGASGLMVTAGDVMSRSAVMAVTLDSSPSFHLSRVSPTGSSGSAGLYRRSPSETRPTTAPRSLSTGQALTRNSRSTRAMCLKSASWETAITRVVITSATVAFIGPNPSPSLDRPIRQPMARIRDEADHAVCAAEWQQVFIYVVDEFTMRVRGNERHDASHRYTAALAGHERSRVRPKQRSYVSVDLVTGHGRRQLAVLWLP